MDFQEKMAKIDQMMAEAGLTTKATMPVPASQWKSADLVDKKVKFYSIFSLSRTFPHTGTVMYVSKFDGFGNASEVLIARSMGKPEKVKTADIIEIL